jgi:PiT family inorganic phosphate transporter
VLTAIAGSLLGWTLGANDAANVFGTAVSSRMILWRRAAVLSAVFIILGAALQGAEGVHTLAGLTTQGVHTAGVAALAAALTLALMTWLRLPVSSSQAVVGALVGLGLAQRTLNLEGLGKVIACWVGTPLGALFFAVLFYLGLRWLLRLMKPSVFALDPFYRVGLIVCGCNGAYALGANNVANVASFFAVYPTISAQTSVLLGGVFIAVGVLTFSRGVMMTVGRGVTPLDAFSALVVVLAQAVTVHVYALVGVPVSTSQAVVGAVLGIGMVKGIQIINGRVLVKVIAGWVSTPILAAIIGFLLAAGTRHFRP